ncbi:Uma2 family endonuclease [Desulfitobacterium sp.]|uniref:Uma2 family endonuclease n=1 Tax=Desulfitobacterium sp. TaxID=49981 RepID=UPI002B1F9B16|nr:Uma2 family endonuclease [Desulfitobacterium sp.]MEA4902891.1 Uma2 family endonuclease [Desulfitobacterium sp.]
MIPNKQPISYEEFLELDQDDDNLEFIEFIDGKIYLQSAPSVIHQTVVTNLSTEFGIYFKGKECRHFVAPFDVVFENNENTHRVQPDLTVICDKNGLNENNYKGVPILVVEVLSPSTASKDYIQKMDLYMGFGVQEYWIVSPKSQTVEVFFLKEDGTYSEPIVFSKDDVVRSGVLSELEIRLSDIFPDFRR